MDMRERIKACLSGIMAGDAFGAPYEMKKPEEILAATGGNGPTELVSTEHARANETRTLKPGETTDDWLFTAAVAESLIRRGGFVLEDMALCQVEAYCRCPFGMGGTVSEALASIHKHFQREEAKRRGMAWLPFPPERLSRKDLDRWRIAEPRHFASPAQVRPENRGMGNGVAMKIAPLAIFRAVRDGGRLDRLLSETMDLGRMTHGDVRASIAGYAIAAAIVKVLHRPITGHDSEEVDRFLHELILAVRGAEGIYQFVLPQDAPSVSSRLDYMKSYFRDPEALRTQIGTASDVLESVPFAIGTFLRRPGNFRAALQEAVSAGGDADSTAAMAGALIGANMGAWPEMGRAREMIPSSWRDRLALGEAEDLGRRLYDAAVH